MIFTPHDDEAKEKYYLANFVIILTGKSMKVIFSFGSILLFFSILHAGTINVFDLDANILMMETPVILFHKSGKEQITVSAHSFDKEIGNVGVRGVFKDYLVDHAAGRSMYYFEEGPHGENFFIDELKEMDIHNSDSGWKGPMWDAFALQCRTPTLCEQTYILTSRNQPAGQIYEGLLYMKKEGLLKNIPPASNIWTVRHPNIVERFEKTFDSTTLSYKETSAAFKKAAVLEELVLKEKARGESVLLKYSDDCDANVNAANDLLLKYSHDREITLLIHHTDPENTVQLGRSYRLIEGEQIPVDFDTFLKLERSTAFGSRCQELLFWLLQ